MGVYSSTAANAYADKIKAVYEHLDEIRRVADRLTPVEDLTGFQTQIVALHAQLDLLVEASNLITTMTPTGESILTGTVATIKTLLEIGTIPVDVVRRDELTAALAALELDLETQVATTNGNLTAINTTVTQLDQYRVSQQAEISGLQAKYTSIQGGLETNQTNTAAALSRLTVQEQHASAVDFRLDSIDQSLASTTTGIQATNNIVSGHTASITSAQNTISLHTASIDSINSSLIDTNSGVAANTSALNLMDTTITGLGQDIVAQSQQTVALKSAIGGSGNLLPNADFAAGANGWTITVAEEDWATTLLTVDTFTMPEEVHCLEVLGSPTPLGQIVVESPTVLIEGGSHYLLSGYPCVDNGTVVLSYKTFDAAGLVVDQGVCPATFNTTTNPSINAYSRTWVKFLASVDADKLRLYLTVTGDGDFITQGALFRPMIEQGWAEQTGPSAWTPNISGVPEALAEAVQTLSTEVSTAQDGVDANTASITALTTEVADKATSTALNALTTRVASTEDTNTAQADQITDLQTDVAGKASASALDTLNTRVGVTPAGHTSFASKVTSMDTVIAGKAASSALDTLDTRVGATPAGFSSFATKITSLDTSIAGKAASSALSTLDSRVGATPAGYSSFAGKITALDTTIAGKAAASALQTLDAEVTDIDGRVTANAGAVTQVTARLATVQPLINPDFELGDVGWNTGLIRGVEVAIGTVYEPHAYSGTSYCSFTGTGVSRDYGVTSSSFDLEGNRRVRFRMWVKSAGLAPNPGVTIRAYIRCGRADGSAVANAYGQVQYVTTGASFGYREVGGDFIVPAGTKSAFMGFQALGFSASNSSYIVFDAAEVVILDAEQEQNVSVTQAMRADVDSVSGKVNASYTLTLDVNGYVTGITSFNNGSYAEFAITADKFKIVAPGGGSRTEFSNGNWRVYDANNVLRVALGVNI